MRLLQFIAKEAKEAKEASNVARNNLKGMRLIRCIVEEVADEYGLTVQQVCGRKRGKSYVDCRMEIAVKLRGRGYSYPEIAEALDRDHTSIMHLIDRNKKNAATSNDTK